MEFIGQYLKSVRLKKSLQLKKISKELKISENLLEDIENDYFPEYINTVFLIGHIRSYAKLLNLDHDKVVEAFKIQSSYNDAKIHMMKSQNQLKLLNFFHYPKTAIFCINIYNFCKFLFFIYSTK